MDTKAFATSIKQVLYDFAPFESDELAEKKHKNRGKDHMRDKALGDNQIIPIADKGYSFDIGNDFAESEFPHYHILEDSEVITKKKRATIQTKGSQDSIKDLRMRNYGYAKYQVSLKGKTSIYQEYRKNVRGSRSLINSSTRFYTDSEGRRWKINGDAKYYQNVHYHYIEKILEATLPNIANQFGLKQLRTKIDNSIGANTIKGENLEIEMPYGTQLFDDIFGVY